VLELLVVHVLLALLGDIGRELLVEDVFSHFSGPGFSGKAALISEMRGGRKQNKISEKAAARVGGHHAGTKTSELSDSIDLYEAPE
jgi:hypothetical protein